MDHHLARVRNRRTLRQSSYEVSGRNADCWTIAPGESRVLADIDAKGAAGGQITHLWMTQRAGYRECLIRITFDDAKHPSVLCPLGDFFGLGHSMVNSYQSILFTASARHNHQFNYGCALNSYVPMPFRKSARVELVNQGAKPQRQYFYVDYELFDEPEESLGYFHAEFRRCNPFTGWAPHMHAYDPHINIANKERLAWDNNYVILDTKGRGHYIGCNVSHTNIQGSWWGEGDDMIWVDGYKWPPDLHGTGSEDYFNQAWGMQPNAYLRNGSSIYEGATLGTAGPELWAGTGGYQTSYVLHVDNPVHFRKSIKVTLECGHGNHLANEMSSVAYWYALKPARVIDPPPVKHRLPVLRDVQGKWILKTRAGAGKAVKLNPEMRRMTRRYAAKHKKR